MSSHRQGKRTRTEVSGWVRAVPIVAAFLVGAASFTLSFFAQADVSTSLGAVPKNLSWLVPIVIDGGILAGSAAVWSASTRGVKAGAAAYLTMVGLLALSVVINVHHASADGAILGAVIAGSPPVVLLLCLELVAKQARREAVESSEADAEPDVALAPVAHTAPVAAPVPALAAVAPPVAEPAPVAQPAPAVGAGPTAQVAATWDRRGTAPELRSAVSATAPRLAVAAAAAPRQEVSATVTDLPEAVAPAVVVERPVRELAVESTLSAPAAVAEPALAEAVAVETATEKVVEPVAAPAPKAPAPAPVVVRAPVEDSAAKPASQADQIRSMFAEHVSNGGDPMDSALARVIATRLEAPIPSVRKIVSQERRALEAVPA